MTVASESNHPDTCLASRASALAIQHESGDTQEINIRPVIESGSSLTSAQSQYSASKTAELPSSGHLDRLAPSGRDDVAIIGMSCRVAGGNNTPEKLWDFLMDKKDASGQGSSLEMGVMV